jgi:hypothetical protein
VKVEIFNACFNQKTLRNSGAARLFLLSAALDKAPENPLQSIKREWRNWQTRWT